MSVYSLKVVAAFAINPVLRLAHRVFAFRTPAFAVKIDIQGREFVPGV
jgi:hypothetical protein